MASESGPYNVELSPVEPGEIVAVIHLENNGESTCTLASTITVTGHAGPPATGAIVKFVTGTGELLVGTQKLELISEVTVSAGVTPTPEEPNPFHRPFGLTTTAT